MVQIGDVIRVKDFQTLGNISGDILNVYYFEVTAITGSIPLASITDELVQWWFGDFLDPVLPLQTSNLRHTRAEIDNVMAFETDFAIVTPEDTVSGSVIGPYNASSTAWSFQMLRQLRTTRHGSKRLAGVPEAYVEDNVPTNAVTALSTAFIDGFVNVPQILTSAGAISLISVIAGTPIPPATLPTVFNPVVGGVFRGVGSQNSRKQLLS